MVSPTDALSIAAAVVQFIDFGIKITAKSRELASSSTGVLVEHKELLTASNRLADLDGGLVHSLSFFREGRKLTQAEAALREVSQECKDMASEFTQTLNGLFGTADQNSFKTFRQAFKAVWHKDGIEAMRQRLDQQRQQLAINLLIVMRYVVSMFVFKLTYSYQ